MIEGTNRYFYGMNRRAFQNNLLWGLLPWPVLPSHRLSRGYAAKPRRLRVGDKIGLIAPGSPVAPERIDQAIDTVTSWGFEPILGKYVREQHGYLAGTDAQRLYDFHAMFADEQVAGIWCLRGGYGCSRLLPLIDYHLIAQHPKVFAGYSDITALHLALYVETGLVSFHGPVAVSKPTDYSTHWWRQMVMHDDLHQIDLSPLHQSVVLRAGKARGRLLGGNLSLMAALAGTRWSPSYEAAVVYIEDVGEKPYRVDRLLTQLMQATDLRRAAAIVLGIFIDCEAGEGDLSLSLADTLQQQFASFRVPVLSGFSIGHIDEQCTLPVGIMAELDTERATLTLQEATVI